MKGVHILKYSTEEYSQILIMNTGGEGYFCSHGKTLAKKPVSPGIHILKILFASNAAVAIEKTEKYYFTSLLTMSLHVNNNLSYFLFGTTCIEHHFV